MLNALGAKTAGDLLPIYLYCRARPCVGSSIVLHRPPHTKPPLPHATSEKYQNHSNTYYWPSHARKHKDGDQAGSNSTHSNTSAETGQTKQRSGKPEANPPHQAAVRANEDLVSFVGPYGT